MRSISGATRGEFTGNSGRDVLASAAGRRPRGGLLAASGVRGPSTFGAAGTVLPTAAARDTIHHAANRRVC